MPDLLNPKGEKFAPILAAGETATASHVVVYRPRGTAAPSGLSYGLINKLWSETNAT
jgi:hypothetical protein